MALMRQTVLDKGLVPKSKPAAKPEVTATSGSEQIFTGPKGGQYVLTASGKKKYLKK